MTGQSAACNTCSKDLLDLWSNRTGITVFRRLKEQESFIGHRLWQATSAAALRSAAVVPVPSSSASSAQKPQSAHPTAGRCFSVLLACKIHTVRKQHHIRYVFCSPAAKHKNTFRSSTHNACKSGLLHSARLHASTANRGFCAALRSKPRFAVRTSGGAANRGTPTDKSFSVRP